MSKQFLNMARTAQVCHPHYDGHYQTDINSISHFDISINSHDNMSQADSKIGFDLNLSVMIR